MYNLIHNTFIFCCTRVFVSFKGTRNAIKKVGFKEIEGGAYRPWFYNATASNDKIMKSKTIKWGPLLEYSEGGSQLGGHLVNYEHDLSFATIHGSGTSSCKNKYVMKTLYEKCPLFSRRTHGSRCSPASISPPTKDCYGSNIICTLLNTCLQARRCAGKYDGCRIRRLS